MSEAGARENPLMESPVSFRPATRNEVPAIVAMLADDVLGAGRESQDMSVYFAAFDTMQRETGNQLFVGVDASGEVVATYQLTVISGLSLTAARRAQVESVRVASSRRGRGLGAQLLADAEARARAEGCALVQLTSNATRDRALRFYQGLGYVPSHVGFKKALNNSPCN